MSEPKNPESSPILRAAHRLIGEDRTGLIAPDAPDRTMRFVAWVAVLSLFVLGWGSGTVRAVQVALGQDLTFGVVTDLSATIDIARRLAIAGTAWALVYVMRRASHSTPVRASWRTQAIVVPVAMAAAAAGFLLYRLISTIGGLTTHEYPEVEHETASSAVLDVIASMMAGPSEELALMALVVTALRTTGYSWTVVCITAVVVRVPFHLYYGWGAIGLGLWAVLIIALYRRTGALLGIITAHALFNGLNSLGDAGMVVKGTLIAVGAGIVLWRVWRLDRDPRNAEPLSG